MKQIQRLTCRVKGHKVEVLQFYLHSVTVNAECVRCGHRLTQEEAYVLVNSSSVLYDEYEQAFMEKMNQ